MANLYDIDQGHTKDATDTKERSLIGRPGVSRYPMPARITYVAGGGVYNCIEVNPATGADISGAIHNSVHNRGDAILAVNDVVWLEYSEVYEVFFFVKRTNLKRFVTHDSYIDQANPNDNFNGGGLYVAYSMSPAQSKRTLLRVESDELPVGYTTAWGCEIYFYVSSVMHGGSDHRITASCYNKGDVFDEATVTWNNADTPGSYIVRFPVEAEGWIQFNVPKNWGYFNAATGCILTPPTETGTEFIIVDSEDSDEEKRPFFIFRRA